jgi:uncharacterized SAM-binding protein YcdF (DUF218 family)
MRMIRKGAIVALVAFVLGMAVTLGSALFSPTCDSVTGRFDTIVVLGAGFDDSGLDSDARDRLDAAIALYDRGIAPRLHVTGGGRDGLTGGGLMQARAIAAGVPDSAITAETLSQSTLQNALFSKPFLTDTPDFLLVTEGFHVWRSWLSFSWAGLTPARACASSAFSVYGKRGTVTMVAVGSVKLWGNAVRAGLWGFFGLIGLQSQVSVDLLA